jgi:hypothetical protein
MANAGMKANTRNNRDPIVTLKEVILLAILLGGIYWLFAPASDRFSQSVKIDDLQGVWTTTAPQYSDRFLQVSGETITFGLGEAGVASYSIEAIDSKSTPQGTLVRLYYTDMASVDYTLNFYFQDQRGGTIQLKSQHNIYWLRENREPTYLPDFK